MNSSPQSQISPARFNHWPKWLNYLVGGLSLWVLLFISLASSWEFAQRLSLSFTATILILAIIWVIAKDTTKLRASGKPLSVKEALVHLSAKGFVPAQKYFNSESTGVIGIAFDESTGNLCFLQRQGRLIDICVFPPSDILESEVIEDGYSITKTSTTSMLGRAIVGRLLLGRLAAVVGGVTAKTSQTDKVKSVDLRIIVNDIGQPVRTISFMSSEEWRGSFVHKTAWEQANHWHALISVLMKRASKGDY